MDNIAQQTVTKTEDRNKKLNRKIAQEKPGKRLLNRNVWCKGERPASPVQFSANYLWGGKTIPESQMKKMFLAPLGKRDGMPETQKNRGLQGRQLFRKYGV